MAKEYIERDTAIEAADITNFETPYGTSISALRRIPTADVVEVVRCKDCKHGIWDEDEQMCKCVFDADYDTACDEYFGFVAYEEADFYCGRGERRDNNADA